MRMAVMVVGLVLFSACDASRCVRASLLEGVDAGTPGLAIVGQSLRFATDAPLSACAGDPLRATVELTGPDNVPRAPLEVAPTFDERTGLATADFSLTPDEAGPWLMRVVFEPSLGVRTFTFDAATSYLQPQGVAVSMARCADPWPVDAETIACTSGPLIEVRSASGAHHTFRGAGLVVADGVLWTNDGTVLERRVVDDAGVHLTHRFDGFEVSEVATLHRRDSALRVTTNDRLAVVRVDGGVEVSTMRASHVPSDALVFDEPSGIVQGRGCLPSDERCVSNLYGLEDEVVWVGDVDTTRAYRRPWTGVARDPLVTIATAARRAEAAPTPIGGFVRAAVRFTAPNPTQVLLASTVGGRYRLSLWSRIHLIRATRHFALAMDDADRTMARIVPLD
ncbi:MAG: hypothetical protein ACOZQL_40940 [Myxococcota bacterium]